MHLFSRLWRAFISPYKPVVLTGLGDVLTFAGKVKIAFGLVLLYAPPFPWYENFVSQGWTAFWMIFNGAACCFSGAAIKHIAQTRASDLKTPSIPMPQERVRK